MLLIQEKKDALNSRESNYSAKGFCQAVFQIDKTNFLQTVLSELFSIMFLPIIYNSILERMWMELRIAIKNNSTRDACKKQSHREPAFVSRSRKSSIAVREGRLNLRSREIGKAHSAISRQRETRRNDS